MLGSWAVPSWIARESNTLDTPSNAIDVLDTPSNAPKHSKTPLGNFSACAWQTPGLQVGSGQDLVPPWARVPAYPALSTARSTASSRTPLVPAL